MSMLFINTRPPLYYVLYEVAMYGSQAVALVCWIVCFVCVFVLELPPTFDYIPFP